MIMPLGSTLMMTAQLNCFQKVLEVSWEDSVQVSSMGHLISPGGTAPCSSQGWRNNARIYTQVAKNKSTACLSQSKPLTKLVSRWTINVLMKDISFLVFSKMILGSSDWQRRQLGAMTIARLFTSILVVPTLEGWEKICVDKITTKKKVKSLVFTTGVSNTISTGAASSQVALEGPVLCVTSLLLP